MGHRYLIKKAARESPWLYILVVEEDRSLFPFHIRFRLIKEGVKDLKNLSVIPGGEYVISSATFPSYFTREEDLAAAQASLDLEVFSTHIAPPLKVIKRYVGEEPYCPVTSVYNRCMKELLPQKGIQVVEVPRLKIGVEAVSASRVRELIKRGEVEKTRELVPESTYSYLVSPEAREVIERIKRSSSRH
jgi:[citrate (pro-3S)-lyase] ligase